ncbi:MAG: histidine kinase [Spirosomaceae bacterium]|nr:histidine kinase [Spirosomataceae bacterium]
MKYILVILWWSGSIVMAQTMLQKPIFFEHYNQSKGLSQGTGYAIAQYDDYLWFGTQDGLNRFDGYGVEKVFRQNKNHSLHNNSIYALLTDSQNRFWIGTGAGINLYDKKQQRFDSFEQAFGHKHLIDDVAIKRLIEDPKKRVWILTEERGIYCFDPSTRSIRSFLTQNASLHDFCIAPDGTLWLSSYQKIYRFDERKQRFEALQLPIKNATNTFFQCILTDTHGQLWVGTNDDGVYVISPTEKCVVAHYQKDKELLSNQINTLMRDARERMWVGTFMGGITIYDPYSRSFQNIYHQPTNPRSLAENNVWQLYQDRQGIVWVGLSGQGIDKYDPQSFQFGLIQKDYASQVHAKSLRDNMIFRLYGHKDQLYIGTETGSLSKFSLADYQFEPFIENTKDPTQSLTREIRNIITDTEEQFWIANWKGLLRIHPAKHTITTYPFVGQRVSRYLYEIKLVKNGFQNEIWVGGEELFLRFDLATKKWKNWADIPALATLANYTIRVMYQDQQQNVWLGTLEHGLFCLDAKTRQIKHFGPKFTCLNIRSFWEEAARLWIGTDCGLIEIDEKSREVVSHITQAQGLPNEVIYAILGDKHKQLWLSTNEGLVCFDAHQKRVLSHYTAQDGLQSNEFNTNVAYRHHDGTLFFGGVNGINYFKSNDIQKNTFVPPVRITHLKVSDSVYTSVLPQISLRYNQNFVEIAFTAFNFSNAHKNQYQYQMTGVDTEWIQTKERRVSYPKLSPGSYVFRVKGSNSDGIWSDNVATITIVITPPFWDTWWFRMGLVALLLLGIWGLYRYRMYQIKEQQAHDLALAVQTQELERERFSKEIHDGLGSSLALLKLYLQSIGDSKINVQELRNRSVHLLSDTIAETQRLIYDMHPKTLAQMGLQYAIEEMTQRINESGQKIP